GDRSHIKTVYTSEQPTPPQSTLFPYTTLFRSRSLLVLFALLLGNAAGYAQFPQGGGGRGGPPPAPKAAAPFDMTGYWVSIVTEEDRKSTRLNSSHRTSSYAVFCLKKTSR